MNEYIYDTTCGCCQFNKPNQKPCANCPAATHKPRKDNRGDE